MDRDDGRPRHSFDRRKSASHLMEKTAKVRVGLPAWGCKSIQVKALDSDKT